MAARAPLLARTLLALLCLATVIGCSNPRPPASGSLPSGERAVRATITGVTDGDTVTVQFGDTAPESARLLGIDTPETVKPKAPVECFGPEASQRTKELLRPGTKVLLQRDREARDRYGRLLVYLWRQDDHLFVNEALVAEGFARTLSIAPNTAHRATLAQAERLARERRAGLWRSCPPDT